MNILFVTTKAPWPLVDGGRVLVRNTIEGLAARGHRITLVTPVTANGTGDSGAGETAALEPGRAEIEALCEVHAVPVRARSLVGAVARARTRGLPVSIARHTQGRVRKVVAALLAERSFDVVHAEQLQALPQTAPAGERGVPVVLRAENVESDVWAATATVRVLTAGMVRSEAARLAAWEGAAVARVAATAALTERDAERLRLLAGDRGLVRIVRAPFPSALPSADGPLPGAPPVVLYGSGWLPNQDATRWFLDSIWPELRAKLPEVRLHVFGSLPRSGESAQVDEHPTPAESREAFAPGSILALPLRIASGVRIRILEAWARGIPVVATPEAVSGLEAEDGRELLVARDSRDFVAAISRLSSDPELGRAMIEAGRDVLRRLHDGAGCAAALEAVYAEAIVRQG